MEGVEVSYLAICAATNDGVRGVAVGGARVVARIAFGRHFWLRVIS